jgi:hypothetical protein
MGAVEFDVSRWLSAAEPAHPAKPANPAKVEALDPQTLAALATLAAQPVPLTAPATALVRWRRHLGTLDPSSPAHPLSPDRWRQLIDDAERFLSGWGNQAAALGWSTIDLFGCSPGFARRLDRDGLVTGLEGRVVTMMTDSHAMIDAGDGKLWRHERRDRPGAVTWWTATHGVGTSDGR